METKLSYGTGADIVCELLWVMVTLQVCMRLSGAAAAFAIDSDALQLREGREGKWETTMAAAIAAA